MAPNYYFISFLFATFLLACCVLVQAREIPPFGDIALTREPKDNYYIVKKRPAVIVCEARGAEDISFTCVGSQIPETSVETEDSDEGLIRAQIEVTRSDLFNHGKKQGPFWCECSALDYNGQAIMTSQRTTISIAFLKHKFKAHPKSEQASEGDNVEIVCGVPSGKPNPEVIWRKNKRRLNFENDPRYTVTEQGTLVIESVESKDAGTYSCVAKNPAGRKESKGGKLSVSVFAESSEPAEEVSNIDSEGQVQSRTTRQSLPKPKFELEPRPKYQIKPDEQIEIECAVVAANILTFRCNEKRMPKTQYEMNSNRNDEGVQVHQHKLLLSYSDVNSYYTRYSNSPPFSCVCVAWYPGTDGWLSIETSKDLGAVELVYLEKTFKMEPSDVTAGVNTDATLVCEPPKGKPDPWVNWLKDGVRLAPRENDHYSVNDLGHLTIHGVQEEDAGVYICEAENTGGSVQSKRARLIVSGVERRTQPRPVVTDPPTAPPPTARPEMEDAKPTFPDVIPEAAMFLRDLDDEYIIEPEESATLTCTVVSADQVTFNCAQERVTIKEDNLLSLYDRDSRKRLLQATHEVTAEDVLNGPDEYYCECTAWYIKNKTWEFITSNKGFIRVADIEKEVPTDFIEDQFINYPTMKTVEDGQEAEFLCEAPRGNPKPTVYWLKDGERIISDDNDNSNYYIWTEGPLLVKYVTILDQGEYTCVAENSAGRKFTPAVRLNVIVPEEPTPEPDGDLYPPTTDYYENYDSTDMMFKISTPIFAHDQKDNLYIAGNDDGETLLCSAIGDVKHLVFVCNDQVVTKSTGTGTHMTVPGTDMQKVTDNKLTITREEVDAWGASNQDPYVCMCRAYYAEEGDTADKLSSVDSQPTTIEIAYFKKKFGEEPMDMEVSEGGMAELRCLPPVAVPTPTVYWLKDGFNLMEDERRKITNEGFLIISDFRSDDVGQYTCGAENEFKTRTSKTATVIMTGSVGEHEVCDMGKFAECQALNEQVNAEMSQNQASLEEMCDAMMSIITCFKDAFVGCDDSVIDAMKPMYEQFEKQTENCKVMNGEGTMTDGGDAEPSTEPEVEPEVEPTSYNGVRIVTNCTEPWCTSTLTFISKDLADTYYVTKRKPDTILCEAYNVDRITFSCMNKDIDESRIVRPLKRNENSEREDGTVVSQEITEASLEVTKEDLDNKMGDDRYYCQCFAHYSVPGMEDEQKLSSNMGYVEEAYIKKFKTSPKDTMVKEGGFVSINCEVPMGEPTPEMYWTKDGERVDSFNNALIIDEAQIEDTGYYKCVAENVAGVRESDEILLEVEDAPDAEVDSEDNHVEEGVEGETNEETMVEGETNEETMVDDENETAVGEVEPVGETQLEEGIPEEGAGVVEPTGMTLEEGIVEPTGEIDAGNDETLVAKVVPVVEGSPSEQEGGIVESKGLDMSEGGAAGEGSEQMGKGQTNVNPEGGSPSDEVMTLEPIPKDETMDKKDDMIEEGETKESGEEIEDKEPAAGASKNDPSDGASSVSVSFLLAILTQLMLATLLSWR